MDIESSFSLSAPPYPGPAALIFNRLGIYKFRGQTFLSKKKSNCIIYPSRIWSNLIIGDKLLIETINHETLHAAIYKAGYDFPELMDHKAIQQLLFDDPAIVKALLKAGKIGFFFFQMFCVLFGLPFGYLFTYLIENPKLCS